MAEYMRKSERLFQLVNILRGRRTAITAEQLSDVLEVSVRTVYRDIQTLILSGVHIEGEAGIGYRLQPGYQLPPLMFDLEEMQALLLGLRMVKAWTDTDLASGAQRAEHKIRAVLPEPLLAQADRQPYRVPYFDIRNPVRETHLSIRRAWEKQRKIHIHYSDAEGNGSQRTLWPLGMIFWGERWTLLAWCEYRESYRNFRFDRIRQITVLENLYPFHHERNLEHYLGLMADLNDCSADQLSQDQDQDQGL